MKIDTETRTLLQTLAHDLAGERESRALDGPRQLTVFAEGCTTEPQAGTVVVARVRSRYTYAVGPISYPAEGWVQIGETLYPATGIEIRGPVLFVVSEGSNVRHRKNQG